MNDRGVSVRFYGGARDGDVVHAPDPPERYLRVVYSPGRGEARATEAYRLEWYTLPGIPGRFAGYFTEAYRALLRRATELSRNDHSAAVTMWALAHRGQGYKTYDPVTEEELSQLRARYCACRACDDAERLGLMRGGDARP